LAVTAAIDVECAYFNFWVLVFVVDGWDGRGGWFSVQVRVVVIVVVVGGRVVVVVVGRGSVIVWWCVGVVVVAGVCVVEICGSRMVVEGCGFRGHCSGCGGSSNWCISCGDKNENEMITINGCSAVS